MKYSGFDGRLALLQRVLPNYRKVFFETLAERINRGMYLLAGQPRPEETIRPVTNLDGIELTLTRNFHFLRGKGYLCWQSGLTKWLAACDPDVLIVEANPRYLSTPSAVRWMRARGRPVIGWGLGAPGGGVKSGMRSRFIGQFNVLVTYSHVGAEQYACLGIPKDRIFIAPNAVTLRPTERSPKRKISQEGKLGLLFVGRLQERKRVDSLILACEMLPKDIQPHLVIVGDGPARQRLEILAHQHYPQTIFTGEIHGPDLEPYYSRADLFVLPGTGGLAIQQAMSYGLPVIAGVADGTQSDLVRESNGWQLHDGSVEQLVSVLANALTKPPQLRKMGFESYRIIREEINVEHMVEVFLAAIEQASSQVKGLL